MTTFSLALPSVAAAVSAVPWWAVLCLAVLSLLCSALRAVFPQDSADRLAWWERRWAQKSARDEQAEPPRERQRETEKT